ncbi:DctP family TRAP transporter solute-binding subunit [Natronincola ferrireducens]|uniref:Tripartite ATP-independent transporter solute receptor, DctP family n=1 Tax=Natronincola ferrireducens TaxID=393762 RepID=A0A1G8XN22_9FIRM|nr:DctP family TRAP transporter solute-binding subunit [Natronincola ferrireducens]SDJ91971.1 tripartite ATP-independent transporter solute receptor, DctP family [Natronincola ferrireducens]
MKKAISIVLILVVLLATITGCSNNTTNDTQSNTDTQTKKDAIIIKYGLIAPESHSQTQAAFKFAQHVEEKSQGELKVEVYPNALLGGDVQLTEAVALGTIQMALPSTSTLVMYSPMFGALDMPFMFSSTEKAFNALEGEVGQLLNGELEKVGIKNTGYSFNGIRNITNNVRPITQPEDLKGVKMRVMESPIFIDMFTLLGTNPTPISFGELFTALQQKTVDGQENAASLIYDSKFQEVQKYISLTKHVYGFCANIINLDFYNQLSNEHKSIIDEAAELWLVDWQIAEEDGNDANYVQKLQDDGMEVNEVSEENYKKFAAAVEPMYEKYRKEMGNEIFDLLEKYR